MSGDRGDDAEVDEVGGEGNEKVWGVVDVMRSLRSEV